jgi:hypothetical protein
MPMAQFCMHSLFSFTLLRLFDIWLYSPDIYTTESDMDMLHEKLMIYHGCKYFTLFLLIMLADDSQTEFVFYKAFNL